MSPSTPASTNELSQAAMTAAIALLVGCRHLSPHEQVSLTRDLQHDLDADLIILALARITLTFGEQWAHNIGANPDELVRSFALHTAAGMK